MPSHVHITSSVVESINEHALSTFPNECCGFLFGQERGKRLVNQALAVNNSMTGDQRRRFEISPIDYLRAEQYALDHGTRLLGIYHSHPNHPAIASEHDLAKAMPYFSYVIISVMDNQIDDIKSWKLREEAHEFEEEHVIITE